MCRNKRTVPLTMDGKRPSANRWSSGSKGARPAHRRGDKMMLLRQRSIASCSMYPTSPRRREERSSAYHVFTPRSTEDEYYDSTFKTIICCIYLIYLSKYIIFYYDNLSFDSQKRPIISFVIYTIITASHKQSS